MWRNRRVSFLLLTAISLLVSTTGRGDIVLHRDGQGYSFSMEGNAYDIRSDGSSAFGFRVGNGSRYRIHSNGNREMTFSTPSFHLDLFSNGGMPGTKLTPRRYGLAQLSGSLFRPPLTADSSPFSQPSGSSFMLKAKPTTPPPVNFSTVPNWIWGMRRTTRSPVPKTISPPVNYPGSLPASRLSPSLSIPIGSFSPNTMRSSPSQPGLMGAPLRTPPLTPLR